MFQLDLLQQINALVVGKLEIKRDEVDRMLTKNLQGGVCTVSKVD